MQGYSLLYEHVAVMKVFIKVWIALFVYFTTKAIHLELSFRFID